MAGEISGAIYSSGLVGGIPATAGKTNLIENCRVSATITCITTHAGGFVGNATSSTTTLRGCLFDGTITGSSLANAGYLVGWCATGGSGITLEDCAAYNQHVIGATGCKMDLVLDDTQTARPGSATNTYGGYNVGNSMMVLRNANPALRLTYALMGPAEPVRYPVSHLASYGVGLLFDNLFMVGRSETPHFSATVDDGFTLIQLTASDATITGPNGGWYTLTPAATPNVITIDATIKSSGDFTGDGTEESPYLIGSTADWTKLFLDLATTSTAAASAWAPMSTPSAAPSTATAIRSPSTWAANTILRTWPRHPSTVSAKPRSAICTPQARSAPAPNIRAASSRRYSARKPPSSTTVTRR